VNVGGTGKLPMKDLKRLCEDAGFENVRTYIASGNVVFKATKSERAVKSALEKALKDYAGKSIGVMVRTGKALTQVLADAPFPKAERKFTVAVFLDKKPTKLLLNAVGGQNDEEIVLGKREVYVHYPSGQGRSKLKIKGTEAGTARNMNTIARLAEMAKEL
jgi:uncharacterized protein (DUF1697 family)